MESKIIVPFAKPSNIVDLNGNTLWVDSITVSPRTDLKPCPFCGGEAQLKEDKRLNMWYVTCPSCKVETDVDKTQEKPIAVWNKRNGISN